MSLPQHSLFITVSSAKYVEWRQQPVSCNTH